MCWCDRFCTWIFFFSFVFVVFLSSSELNIEQWIAQMILFVKESNHWSNIFQKEKKWVQFKKIYWNKFDAITNENNNQLKYSNIYSFCQSTIAIHMCVKPYLNFLLVFINCCCCRLVYNKIYQNYYDSFSLWSKNVCQRRKYYFTGTELKYKRSLPQWKSCLNWNDSVWYKKPIGWKKSHHLVWKCNFYFY